MRIGVPKEIKPQEYRVGLTPAAVREYVAAGHEVAGRDAAPAPASAPTTKSIGAAGARDRRRPRPTIFAAAEMIVKVKEPQPVEWKQLRAGQILFTYLHLAPDPEQTRA